MEIIVLDGFTLNPGDLNWKDLEELGDVKVYDRTKILETSIIERIGTAEIIFTNKTPLPKEVLQKVPNVKYIGVLATGYNVVDVNTAKELGITVTNIPSYGTQAVAQFTFGLILELCHHIGKHNSAVKNGEWSTSPDFCFWKTPLVELSGKTIGLIGFGSIGQATAKIAEAFGMKVIVYTRTIKQGFDSVNFVSFEELLAQSDIVSLHCPLTDDTSRGPLINENDLQEALNAKIIAGAAVDVVSKEPIEPSNPLLKVENCIITPHIAWASKEARQRLLNTSVENLKAFLEGKPQNTVS